MRIDSHQHFWKPERGDYGWLTPSLETLYRDFLPGDLAPLLADAGVDHTILVQAAPTIAETRFLLEIAAATPFVSGVVGWVDFEEPTVTATLSSLAEDEFLVGLRPMVQDIEDDNWLIKDGHARVFEAMIENRLVFDALVLPRHLSRLGVVVERHPDLRVVIDHGAKPPIRSEVPASWFEEMANLASHSQVFCKLSGLVTEASEDWSVKDLAPIVDHLLEAFGPDRLLWGSDWPVLNLAGDYPTWLAASETLLRSCSSEEKEAIFGLNAERVYLSRFD